MLGARPFRNRSFAAGSDAATTFYRKFFRSSPILPSRKSKSRQLVKMVPIVVHSATYCSAASTSTSQRLISWE